MDLEYYTKKYHHSYFDINFFPDRISSGYLAVSFELYPIMQLYGNLYIYTS